MFLLRALRLAVAAGALVSASSAFAEVSEAVALLLVDLTVNSIYVAGAVFAVFIVLAGYRLIRRAV